MMMNEQAGMLCERASEVAGLLKHMANPQRLVLLCRLRAGEASVSELIGLCGLSQSGVSQHLARMREGGLVLTRRENTTINYRLADPNAFALIGFLCDHFGADMAK